MSNQRLIKSLNRAFAAAKTEHDVAPINTLVKMADPNAFVFKTTEGERYEEPGSNGVDMLPRQAMLFTVHNLAGDRANVSAVRYTAPGDTFVFKAHAF